MFSRIRFDDWEDFVAALGPHPVVLPHHTCCNVPLEQEYPIHSIFTGVGPRAFELQWCDSDRTEPHFNQRECRRALRARVREWDGNTHTVKMIRG